MVRVSGKTRSLCLESKVNHRTPGTQILTGLQTAAVALRVRGEFVDLVSLSAAGGMVLMQEGESVSSVLPCDEQPEF